MGATNTRRRARCVSPVLAGERVARTCATAGAAAIPMRRTQRLQVSKTPSRKARSLSVLHTALPSLWLEQSLHAQADHRAASIHSPVRAPWVRLRWQERAVGARRHVVVEKRRVGDEGCRIQRLREAAAGRSVTKERLRDRGAAALAGVATGERGGGRTSGEDYGCSHRCRKDVPTPWHDHPHTTPPHPSA